MNLLQDTESKVAMPPVKAYPLPRPQTKGPPPPLYPSPPPIYKPVVPPPTPPVKVSPPPPPVYKTVAPPPPPVKAPAPPSPIRGAPRNTRGECFSGLSVFNFVGLIIKKYVALITTVRGLID